MMDTPLAGASAGAGAERVAGPGDLYRFPLGSETEAAPEWLLVRTHPDDPHLLLAVPVDEFPLAGVPDVVLPAELVRRRLAARCGQGQWIPADHLVPPLRVGAVPVTVVQMVRRKVAELARGHVSASEEQQRTDLDPAYGAWMAQVEEARERLRNHVNH
jgi:hypothetical protein